MSFYHGNEPGGIPGIPDGPYYWWEAGGLFGTLIQRWSITGNDTLNDIITQGMQFQVGSGDDFQPLNQTKDLGNDDQVFWAFAAMDAAEVGFPNPPSSDPSWTSLAQAVFNEQTARWDSSNCGGGMRWQIVFTNPGYDYKNVMSNGGYFQLAARLARYTGNDTYAKYAEKTYDWLAGSPMFDNSTGSLQVWDGIHIENCSGVEKLDWSYNPTTL
jgi:mannan endo-1,6-alpha-mannosidase